MDLANFKEIKGLELVSSEAYIMGNIADVKYNRDTWKVKGLRINQSGRFKKSYPEIHGKVLIAPSTKFVVGDVLILNHNIAELKTKMISDIEEIDLVSMLMGKKIITSEGKLVGTLDAVYLNLDNWSVVSVSVRLDKEAHAPLGVKKLLFNKTVSGVQTAFFANVGETIKLKITMEDLKKQIIIEE